MKEQMKKILCHHDWHFILCFIILVFIFIGSILLYSECDLQTNNSITDKLFHNQLEMKQKNTAENNKEKKNTTKYEKVAATEAFIFSARTISSQSTTSVRTSSSQSATSDRTTTKHQRPTTIPIPGTSPLTVPKPPSTLPSETFLTTRGWIFPNQLRKDDLKNEVKLIDQSVDNAECGLVFIGIVLSAVGLLLLLLLWCLVILYC